jgi:hypothetical protein
MGVKVISHYANVGFQNIIHATKIIKQNYLRVSKISLDKSKVV